MTMLLPGTEVGARALHWATDRSSDYAGWKLPGADAHQTTLSVVR